MKCPHCGAQVGLEDKYCPFCGLPNEFAKKHQEDMDRYQQEFQQTQSDVYQKTRRFTELTVPLTVVFVLIILNIGAYIFVSKSWEIGSSLQKQEIHTHLTEHQENIDTYIQNGEFCGLSSYYSQNSLYYEDEFDKYNALIRASDSYRDIIPITISMTMRFLIPSQHWQGTFTISLILRRITLITKKNILPTRQMLLWLTFVRRQKRFWLLMPD